MRRNILSKVVKPTALAQRSGSCRMFATSMLLRCSSSPTVTLNSRQLAFTSAKYEEALDSFSPAGVPAADLEEMSPATKAVLLGEEFLFDAYMSANSGDDVHAVVKGIEFLGETLLFAIRAGELAVVEHAIRGTHTATRIGLGQLMLNQSFADFGAECSLIRLAAVRLALRFEASEEDNAPELRQLLSSLLVERLLSEADPTIREVLENGNAQSERLLNMLAARIVENPARFAKVVASIADRVEACEFAASHIKRDGDNEREVNLAVMRVEHARFERTACVRTMRQLLSGEHREKLSSLSAEQHQDLAEAVDVAASG